MIIGSRGSALAQVQAHYVADLIQARLRLPVEIKIIHTQGDRITDRPLRELEGRGYFTKEIEEALLVRDIDLAVHSFKDMPSKAPDGLALAAVSVREDPADLLIARHDAYNNDHGVIPLLPGKVVGTSAVRREAQMRALRSDLQSKDLRGNVPTRVSKIADGSYDAIFLASAGIRRLDLDLSAFRVVRFDPSKFVPAPGQGALAIQMRTDDSRLLSVRAALHDQTTATATSIERDVQARFGGGCGLPLGAHAFRDDHSWHVYGFWAGDNAQAVWADVHGTDPYGLADELFARLNGNH